MQKAFSFHCDFGKREKDTFVKSSGMNAMCDFPWNFRLSMKFSILRENKIGFNCTKYFRSIVVLVFVLTKTCTKQVRFMLL